MVSLPEPARPALPGSHPHRALGPGARLEICIRARPRGGRDRPSCCEGQPLLRAFPLLLWLCCSPKPGLLPSCLESSSSRLPASFAASPSGPQRPFLASKNCTSSPLHGSLQNGTIQKTHVFVHFLYASRSFALQQGS